MKKISIFLFSLLASKFCIAQTDSVIAPVPALKKGFYKNYQEYLDNNPSINGDFTTQLFRASKKDTTVIAASFKLLTNENINISKLWGFCDGESVFIRYKVLIGNNFWKAQVLGPKPYFLYKEKMIFAAGPPLMALATAAATAAVPAGFDVMVVTGKGRPKYVWNGTMKKILADQPELLAAYKKEVNVISDFYRAKYLKLYNEAATRNKTANN